jgi:8-oxo-dGTP pyrophosphatase MutT (NUDIX family)
MIDLDRPIRVARIDITVGAPPALAAAERAAIAAHWAREVAANPALWNGSGFVFAAPAIREGTFHAVARPTDFATQLYRLRVGLPGHDLYHVFPVPAVTTRDRRLLIGRQAAQTANGGLSYPPSGSFDHDDVVDGRLDPIVNMRRELAEEVGLALDGLEAAADWWVIPSGPRTLALVRPHRSPLDAAALGARIAAARAASGEDELDRIDFPPLDAPLAATATVPYVPLLVDLLAAEERAPETQP